VSDINSVPCKGCGKPIIFARLPNGGTVPLDVKAPVYRLAMLPLEEQIIAHAIRSNDAAEINVGDVYVTHFSTCSKANEFSKSKKAAT
jgi:hypothetical protein